MSSARNIAAALLCTLSAALLPLPAHAADAAPAVVPTASPVQAPAPAATLPAPSAVPPASPPAAASAPSNTEPEEAAPVSAFGRSRRVGLPPRVTRPRPAAEDEEVRADDGLLGSHQLHFFGAIGYRGTRITSEGYQPFAKDQAFHQLSLAFGRVLVRDRALSFALGAGWDYGASEADARGSATTLHTNRLTLVPEIRYHLLRRLYAFGKVGAGVAFVDAALADSVTQSERESERITFTVDPSVGIAYEVIGEPAGASRQPRAWLLLDGGYLFTPSVETVLANSSGVPSRTEDHAFAELGLSGLTGRLSAALTF